MTLQNKSLITLLMIALLTVAGAAVFASDEAPAEEPKEEVKAAAATEPVETEVVSSDRVVVYYLHGTRRCATCIKLENYAHEAIEAGFEEQLKSGAIQWSVINYEDEGNEHFVDDYKLYSKAVILSRIEDGKETGWKNLDKIWELVRDKEKYLAYVTDETKAFLEAKAEVEAEEE